MRLFAVHDKKAKAFVSFHVVKSNAVASRDFAQAVLEPKSLLAKYAEDFELVVLADVDDEYRDAPRSSFHHQQVMGCFEVVISAQQVLDLQPKAGATVDPAQLQLMGEA